MERDYYRLGSIEECALRRHTIVVNETSGKRDNDDDGEICFPVEECIEYEGDVYVLMDSVVQKMQLRAEWLERDSFLEILNGIAKRTGHFPIVKIDSDHFDINKG